MLARRVPSEPVGTPCSMDSPTYAPPVAPQPGFRLTFTQGLLAGQLSIIVVAIIFIRYFIFEDVDMALEKERLAVRTLL